MSATPEPPTPSPGDLAWDEAEAEWDEERSRSVARLSLSNGSSVTEALGAALDAGENSALPPHLNGHGRKPLRAALPQVRVNLMKLHEAIADVTAALAHEHFGDPLLFQRSGALVTVADADPSRRSPLAPGTPTIHAHTKDSLLPRLTEHLQILRYAPPDKAAIRSADMLGVEAEGEHRPATAPPQLVASLLATRGGWPGVRHLVGVTESPMLRPDGSVWQCPGYDHATGYLFAPSCIYPAVADRPTQTDAQMAAGELAEVFADFPYASDAARAVPLAAILTLLARPAIRGAVPAFLFDASTRGSGKTLQADIVSLIATGRLAARCTFPEDDEELEKTLSSYALAGAPVVLLDNVTRPFGGAPLDKVLTATDDIDFRLLGRSEIRRLPWRAVVLASGNNLQPGDDTLRRVLVSRLESPLEHPERRADFVHPDLVEWVRAERPRLVAAGLTILRAWFALGRPDAGTGRWGSFDAWAALIPHALCLAGVPDLLAARPSQEQQTDEVAALASLLYDLPRLAPDGIRTRDIVARLYPPPAADEPPDGFEDLRDAIDTLCPRRIGHPTPHALGKVLARHLGRILGGHKLVRSISRGSPTWSVWRA